MHVKCLQYGVLYGTNQTCLTLEEASQDHGVRVRVTDATATFGEGAIGGMPRGSDWILKGCDWIRVIIYSIYEVYIGRPIEINHRFSHVMIGHI